VKNNYQLVIPMTGVGQRFVNAGFRDLKPLIETGQGSMISNVLKMFPSNDSPTCIINQSEPQKNALKNAITRIRPKATILEIPPHKKGPSFAVWSVKDFLDLETPTIVSYCDFSGIWSEQDFISDLLRSDGLIQTYTGFHPHMLRNTKFAYVQKDSDGNVINIQEKKPFTENPLNEEASSGVYGFRTGKIMLDAIEVQLNENLSLNGEFYTSLTYLPILRGQMKVRTLKMDKFFQWGTPEDLNDFRFWRTVSQFKIEPSQKENLSASLVLAGGKGSRISNLSKVPKPCIPVFQNKLWHFAADLSKGCTEKIVFSSSHLQKDFESDNPFNFKIVTSNYQTASQAESAFEGLKRLSDSTTKVHVLSCDNIVFGTKITEVDALLKNVDLVIWVASDYAISKKYPQHFTWVEIDSESRIKRLMVKEASPSETAKVIIGNFSFRSVELAKVLIEETIQHKSSSKSEVYLDWVIQFAIERQLKIVAIEVDQFWAIGTPDEYATAKYWEEVFDTSRVIA
jgi:NDP-sugar pyrophosphorylase family protein